MRAIPSLLPAFAFLLGLAACTAATAATGGLVLAPGEPLTAAHLERLLAGRLPPATADARVAVDWISPPLPLANPAHLPTRLGVERFVRDEASGRVALELRARLESGETTLVRFAGFLRRLVAVPVPVEAVAAGTVLTGDMLEPLWLVEAGLPLGTVRRDEEAIGLEARRRLAAGRPIAERDLVPPRLVRRGEPVTMVYRVPGLELLGVGRALEDGTLGAPVRLVNPDTRRTVRGIVVGRRRVAIAGTLP